MPNSEIFLIRFSKNIWKRKNHYLNLADIFDWGCKFTTLTPSPFSPWLSRLWVHIGGYPDKYTDWSRSCFSLNCTGWVFVRRTLSTFTTPGLRRSCFTCLNNTALCFASKQLLLIGKWQGMNHCHSVTQV